MITRKVFRNNSVSHISGVIFVVDSNDRERMEEAKDEMWRMMNQDELRDAVFLILANKQGGSISCMF